jgi:hypothetical protein
MNRKYVIINADEVSSVDFNNVLETSASTLRYNVAGDQTFVKYEGVQPSFLAGKTPLNHSQMLEILSSEDWTTTDIRRRE